MSGPAPRPTASGAALRVGFTPIGGAQWTGGRTWQLNLLRATCRYESARVRPVVFCGIDLAASEVEQFAAIPGVELVRAAAFDAGNSRRRLARSLLIGRDREAVEAFLHHEIDVAFESAVFYGWRCPLPVIAWLPDFQHRHMPEQFSIRARWKREIGFRAQVASGRIVMVSSEDARKDCEHFYLRSAGRTAVVRFAAPIDDSLFESDPLATARAYGLPRTFIYLPNQFWKHKDHATAIDAVAILRDRGIVVTIAASGNPVDPRHPEHYAALRARVEALGIPDRFRFLGMIPRPHLVSLLRTCAALINPSLFEGWSSTVEESRSLGVPLLLSDIRVHREQMGDTAIYFDPANPVALADAIEKTIQHPAAPATPRLPGTGSDVNVRRFAADFASVVECAAGKVQAKASDARGKHEAARA